MPASARSTLPGFMPSHATSFLDLLASDRARSRNEAYGGLYGHGGSATLEYDTQFMTPVLSQQRSRWNAKYLSDRDDD